MKLFAAAALAAVSIAGSAQAAPLITFTPGGMTTAAGTMVIQNFDSFTPGAMIGTNAFALNASQNYLAIRPAYGSTGNYGAALSGGSYSISFAPSAILSFVLGSLDTFNTLTLNYADGSTPTVLSGDAIIGQTSNGSNGNTSSPLVNGVVTYTVASGPLLTGATFASSQNAFEFDNIAASLPEPAAWGMMILGFGLVGGVMRRRPSVSTKVKFA